MTAEIPMAQAWQSTFTPFVNPAMIVILVGSDFSTPLSGTEFFHASLVRVL
ncbi:MAG: hypothetical protein GY815_03160 [Gammaproteobacteria bacterium]|nr:hypothetical protein [Gammaproteobacteria bacterium]